MARRRDSGDDNDFNIFNSNESIERQTAQWRKASEDVINHTVNYFESRLSRMNANLKKELGDPGKQSGITASLIQKKLKEQQGQPSQGSGSIKDNFINNLINQVGTGNKWDPNKSFMRTAGKELVGLLERSFSTYITKPITSAISDMSSAYESSFSEIAGRMGSNNRKATYNIMKSAVSQLNNSAAKTAVNANKELIPELRNVAARGWKGNEAVSTALTNSIDRKIMPWLDSSTEAWSNLQFNLSDTQMKTLKSQQLILQETQSGNRLLQTGVINQMMTDIAPVLSNIDFNTLETDKLPVQMQNYMQSLVENGYDTQTAYEEARKIMQIYKDPTAGFRNGDAYSVLASQAAYEGGDFKDIAESTLQLDEMLSKLGRDAGIAAYALGGSTASGVNRAEAYGQRSAAIRGTEWDKASDATAGDYDNLANNVSQYVTATQAHDNWMQNTATEWAYFMNKIAHGTELIPDILSTLGSIASALIMGKIGKYVLGKYAPELLKTAGKTGGLAAGLAKGGSAMAKTAGVGLTGNAAKLLGGATVAGGGFFVSKGISTAYDTAKNWDKSSTGDKWAGGLSSAGMIGGGGMAVAAGLGLASGPVGWAGLLIAGAAYAGKKLYDFATDMSESDKKIAEASKSVSDTYQQQISKVNDSAKSVIDMLSDGEVTLEDENTARKFLVDNGILTSTEAQQQNSDQLKALTQAYLRATNDFETKEDKNAKKTAQEEASNLVAQSGQALVDAAKDVQNMYKDDTIAKAVKGYKKSGLSEESAKQQAEAQWEMGELDITGGKGEDSAQIKLLQSLAGQINDPKKKAAAQDKIKKYSEEGMTGMEFGSEFEILKAQLGTAATAQAFNYTEGLEGIDLSKIWSEQRAGTATESYRLLARSLVSAYDMYSSSGSSAELSNMLSIVQKMSEFDLPQTSKDNIKSDYSDVTPAYNILKNEKMKGLPKSYSVGTPYVNEDQLARIHKGEAIIPAEQNKSRLRSMLGISSSEVSQTKVSSTEIVNAIQSQTSTLKQAIDLIISTIGNLQPAGVSYDTRHVGNDLSRMNSTYGNTRNLS